MAMIRNTFLLVLMFLFCAFLSGAQTVKLSLPPSSEKVSGKQNVLNDGFTVYENVYSSQLPKEEILKFYRSEFSSLDMQEFNDTKNSEYYAFQSIPEKMAYIKFNEPQADGKTNFTVLVYEREKCPILPGSLFTSPEKLDFAPVYSGSRQFLNARFSKDDIYFAPMTAAAAYLAKSNSAEVSSFYIDNMPSFGWVLAQSSDNDGIYDFSQWAVMIDPFTKAVPLLEAKGYKKKIPPLKVKGKTLTFKQGNKKCVITIYTFEDMIEKAEGTIWDANTLRQYGDTVIVVYYLE